MNLSRPPIPLHILAGPLGVGKTTAILSYVERNAGREHVAVLVNDFGPVGLDGAIMQGTAGRVAGDQMKVLTIPGGCMCCASADALTTGLPRLAQLPGVTRIIIEPSGIAMPAQVVDLVRAMAGELNLDVRPTIVLLDLGEFASETAERMPYYRRLVESADVLVGNRRDRASDKAISRFEDWAKRLDPPKLRTLTTTMGELPDALFELPGSDGRAPEQTDRAHDHEHAHEHDADARRAGGRTWPPGQAFNLAALRTTIDALPVTRFKGIFHTDAGWKLIELARGERHERFTEHRRDNRCDWITPPEVSPPEVSPPEVDASEHDAAHITAQLDACRARAAAQ